MCCNGQFTVGRNKAPEWVVFNPFISGGYRKKSDFWSCFKSIFTIHNETGNIWTHLFAAIFLFFYVQTSYKRLENLNSTEKYMFLATGIAAIFCFLTSSIYHTFGCYSARAFDILLHFDYAGIILLEATMAASSEYFGFCCFPVTRKVHMSISILLGLYVVCIVLGPVLVKPSPKVQKFIVDYWNVTFGVFFFYGLVPLIHWGYIYGLDNEESPFFWRVLLSFVFLLIGSLIYLYHIPERWLQGRADYFLNSHQLWHLFTFVGTVYQIQNGIDWQTGEHCRKCAHITHHG